MNKDKNTFSFSHLAEIQYYNATKSCLTIRDALKYDNRLKNFLITDQPKPQIDLGNPLALKMYNQILAKMLFGLTFDIPPGRLIPTICVRKTFLEFVFNNVPQIKTVLEIGAGASGIISLICAKKYGCFVSASEADPISLQWLQKNIQANALQNQIKIINSSGKLIKGLRLGRNHFDLVITNPPYYTSKDTHYLEKKRGFLGSHVELVSGPSPTSFLKMLYNELLESLQFHAFATMLPKKEWVEDFLQYVTEKNVPVERVIGIIKAGTRRRYAIIIKNLT